jgi:hypothetical protein
MRKTSITAGVAALMALPLMAAPLNADAATCKSRKTTGTLLGGVGGALLGNEVSHGGGGAIIGGLGGAVVGHEIGKSGCAPPPRARVAHRRAPSGPADRTPPRAVRKVYYDQYGDVVRVAPVSERR